MAELERIFVLPALVRDAIVRRPMTAAERIEARRANEESLSAPAARVDRVSQLMTPIPAHFQRADFGDYRAMSQAQSKAARTAQDWVRRAITGMPAMLALVGPPGVGKSHLLYAAARRAFENGARVYARPWHDLADDLRYGGVSPWTGTHHLEAHQVRAQLYRERIVLMDDVRPTANTAFDDTELTKFAVHAYDANLPVFITSNVYLLDEILGAAAASRFTQLLIDGPDWRQKMPESDESKTGGCHP